MTDVFVVGGGGREHAICWKLRQSPAVGKIFWAPGNAGSAGIQNCERINVSATDIDGIVKAALDNGVGFVVVGADDPLALGAVDALRAAGVRAFGPTKAAARLESSKSYAKDFMREYGVPTAEYAAFGDFEAAARFAESFSGGCVVKADGLALGKGVVICQNADEAKKALEEIFGGKFGAAGKSVVVEERLNGREVSVLAFCDGKTLVPMVSARDHKRAKDGDLGLNTGGMGVIAPVPDYTAELAAWCEKNIFERTINGIKDRGLDFRGVIYFEMMIDGGEAKVIEYNARFGDPEAQAVLPLLESDLFEIFDDCERGELDGGKVKFSKGAAACVMVASGGYPEKYAKGFPIRGIGAAEGRDCIVFHSGTAERDGEVVTDGGRVLGVMAAGADLAEALEKAYAGVREISFEGGFFRGDIGRNSLF